VRTWTGGLAVAALGVAGALTPAAPGHTPVAAPVPASAVALPLEGRVVVLDAGHQLGNSRFPRQIDEPVPAGGFTKPCNTTGTSTDGGYPEATFAFAVTRLVRERLVALGARVILTRPRNSRDLWGPASTCAAGPATAPAPTSS